jgi:molecular chaperone DnaK (HSP70)
LLLVADNPPQADHINIIDTWPAKLNTHEGITSPKAPTELRYTTDGTEWGFQIPSIVDRHQWFKIGLHEKTTAVAGKTSDQLTTEYLAELYKHLMYTLEQKIGAALLRNQQIEFCLTVPAIWRETAKEKTKAACQKAGFKTNTEIYLVSEPEAAAISALHGLDPHGLQIGESFVLCDAGGGTVDLITYTITALHPILCVREAASGTGGLCGSTFLNRRFGEFLSKRLGGEAGWDNEILAEAMERFDTVIKKQYSPSSDGDEGYTVLVPGLANNPKLGIRRGRFTIRPADMRAVFEPIILKIIELVRGQISSSRVPIRAVLLVGGFGQNAYLKERMRAALGGTEVLQPPGAWTAIVSGAVMMGLARANRALAQVSVVSRSARKHYGVELIIPFNAAVHAPSTKYVLLLLLCPRPLIVRVPADDDVMV